MVSSFKLAGVATLFAALLLYSPQQASAGEAYDGYGYDNPYRYGYGHPYYPYYGYGGYGYGAPMYSYGPYTIRPYTYGAYRAPPRYYYYRGW